VDGGSANSTLLTTIVATSPIHFYFTGSESDYLKYVRLAKDGKRGSARSEGLPVQIKLLDEDEFLHEATLDFVDNEIDSQTGTIESRAVLRNDDHLLEPGMFGKARIIGSDEHGTVTFQRAQDCQGRTVPQRQDHYQQPPKNRSRHGGESAGVDHQSTKSRFGICSLI
jgi:multidrug efflux pump subunit AcrA (membrane-fusion protein)